MLECDSGYREMIYTILLTFLSNYQLKKRVMYYMVGNNTFPENTTDDTQCWDVWTILNFMLDDSLEVKLASCEVAVPTGLFV